MPVILRLEAHEVWLSPDAHEGEPLTRLLRPYPYSDMSAYAMSAYAVYTLVNSPSNDNPRCVEPLLEN